MSRIDITFARDVPADVFHHLPSVREVAEHGHLLTVTVQGPVDALVKAAARFEVLTIKTHEPDLEEVFLSYYKDDSDAA